MIAFTDFLANNYLWFLVISIILFFALIGYFVDQSEQKKGISMFHKVKEEERDIRDLAAVAANKTLNTAITDASKKSAEMAQQNNVITTANNTPVQNTPGFEPLTK